MKIKRLFLLFLILFFMSFSFSFSATPSKVLILPFEVNAPQDLHYLKKAIPEMLTSRLFSPDKIQVIESEVVEEELKNYQKLDRKVAEELGKKLSADYVIWGSVTVLGEVVSIDAQIMDLKGEKKPAQFFQEVKGLSEVIPQITRFARKSKLYIEGKEEDFYREDLSLAMAGPGFVPGRAHPERGYFGYAPYPVRPRTEEPPVEKAKPRFGGFGDPAYEGGLLGNLVIDLSGNQPRIGFAKSEEEKGKGNQTQGPPPYLYYYPPQPYYNYSPPPYYYYQKPPQEEGLLSKMKRWIWPFGKEESRPIYPQPLYPQPIPVSPQVSPQPQGFSTQASSPSQNTAQFPTPQPVPKPLAPPSQPQVSPAPQPTPPQPSVPQPLPQSTNNPWRWE